MKKKDLTVLFVVIILFWALYLILSFNSRLATDDYYFISDIKNHGTFEQVWFQYFNWSGRHTATLTINILYNLFKLEQQYYNILPLINYVLLLMGSFLLIKKVFKKIKLKANGTELFLTATFFIFLLFFLSYDIGESWFWYCGYSSYLWSIIAFIWGVAFLISSKNKNLTTIISSICFIYVGGTSEIYSSLFSLAFIVYFIYKQKNSDNIKSFINEHKNQLIVFLLFSISFLVCIIAPGNYLRDELFPEHKFSSAIFITAKAFVKFLIIYLPSKIPYIIAFSFPFILIGNKISEDTTSHSIPIKSILKRISIVFIITMLVFFLLVAYVMMETGPARILFFITFIFSTYISICAFSIGYYKLLSKKYFVLLKIGSYGLMSSILVFHLVNQYKITTYYKNKNDERIDQLVALNKTIQKDTLIYLKPLPPSGMLYSAEITADTNHFTNKELKLGYNLNFHVAVEKP